MWQHSTVYLQACSVCSNTYRYASPDPAERQMEYLHHGDPLVPRQQRFGLYTRSLMKGLGVPVENRWGLRPAVVPETNQIAPLNAMRDLDTHGWLTGVTTFNFHPHLPHYALTTDDAKLIRVLARQPIDMSRPHPFTEAGNREFNTFLWMPPSGTRAGDIILADLTMFTTLFGGAESLTASGAISLHAHNRMPSRSFASADLE